MDPRDFNRLAERLAAGSCPAEYRTAISRAYHAAFNVASDALRAMGFRVAKGAAAHGEVLHSLNNSADPALTAAASELGLPHTMRNRADYQLERIDIETRQSAMQLASIAKDLIRTIDAALTGPGRAQVQATIAKWRRDNGYP